MCIQNIVDNRIDSAFLHVYTMWMSAGGLNYESKDHNIIAETTH